VNNTLNQSGVFTGFLFNDSVGSYLLNVTCEDSFFNSTFDSITLDYNVVCIPVFTGLSYNARFRNNIVPFSVVCENNVSLSDCSYSINEFASEGFDCSVVNNLTLEVGVNNIVFSLSDGVNLVDTEIRVYAKQSQSGLAGYVGLFLVLIIFGIGMWAYMSFGKPIILGIFAVLVLGVFGAFVLSFSIWLSLSVWLMALILFFLVALNP